MNLPLVLTDSVRGRLFSKQEISDSKRLTWSFLHRGCNRLVDSLELASKASRRSLMIVTASPAAAKNLKFPPILLITMLKLYTRLFQFIGSDHMMIVLYVPTPVAFLFVP